MRGCSSLAAHEKDWGAHGGEQRKVAESYHSIQGVISNYYE